MMRTERQRPKAAISTDSPWDSLLAIGFCGAIAGGVLLVAAPDFVGLAWLNRSVEGAFFDAAAPEGAAGMRRWLYAVVGATLAAFGILGLRVARTAFRRRQRWARDALALAIGVWFPLDTVASAASGVWANVALNVVIAAVLLLPILALWRRFPGDAEPESRAPPGAPPEPGDDRRV